MGIWSKLKKKVIKDSSDKKEGNVNDVPEKQQNKQKQDHSNKKQSKNIQKDNKQTKKEDLNNKDTKKEEIIIKKDTGDAYKILLEPVLSEKTVMLEEKGKYVFKVAPFANKVMIKKAVYKLYGVKPLKVSITKVPAKQVRFRWRKGMRSAWKKAIVTCKKGDKIDLTI